LTQPVFSFHTVAIQGDVSSLSVLRTATANIGARYGPRVTRQLTNFSLFHGSAVEFVAELHQYRFGDLEFFNLFNHATFAPPGEIISASNFGISTGTASAERQIQFAARIVSCGEPNNRITE